MDALVSGINCIYSLDSICYKKKYFRLLKIQVQRLVIEGTELNVNNVYSKLKL